MRRDWISVLPVPDFDSNHHGGSPRGRPGARSRLEYRVERRVPPDFNSLALGILARNRMNLEPIGLEWLGTDNQAKARQPGRCGLLAFDERTTLYGLAPSRRPTRANRKWISTVLPSQAILAAVDDPPAYYRSNFPSLKGWLTEASMSLGDFFFRAQDELNLIGDFFEVGVYKGKIYRPRRPLPPARRMVRIEVCP